LNINNIYKIMAEHTILNLVKLEEEVADEPIFCKSGIIDGDWISYPTSGKIIIEKILDDIIFKSIQKSKKVNFLDKLSTIKMYEIDSDIQMKKQTKINKKKQ